MTPSIIYFSVIYFSIWIKTRSASPGRSGCSLGYGSPSCQSRPRLRASLSLLPRCPPPPPAAAVCPPAGGGRGWFPLPAAEPLSLPQPRGRAKSNQGFVVGEQLAACPRRNRRVQPALRPRLRCQGLPRVPGRGEGGDATGTATEGASPWSCRGGEQPCSSPSSPAPGRALCSGGVGFLARLVRR